MHPLPISVSQSHAPCYGSRSGWHTPCRQVLVQSDFRLLIFRNEADQAATRQNYKGRSVFLKAAQKVDPDRVLGTSGLTRVCSL